MPTVAELYSLQRSIPQESRATGSDRRERYSNPAPTARGQAIGDFLQPWRTERDAFIYYGSFGLVDPKNALLDAPALKSATGMSYGKSLATVTVAGFFGWGLMGWVIDPSHKRPGGLDETDTYKWWFNSSAWQNLKAGWEMGEFA